ncbi:DUF6318 family protein [Modestobacter sp. VKM Ac-2983]|uniref:DUF6318 family protein n=1 Tax=Modestobacter sp. VKM Ac-2983 TaxID=3004137 RepID=UPI0022ABB75E|nr:DUF6318 family protein [Modestobacter sp. VKM Ac-2983]MCZ2803734.1 DUF6318 family protein [Modestobacter sp. VKM Ac-2983]
MAIAVLGACSRGESANETLPDAAPSSSETSEALPPLGPPDLPMPPAAREQTPAGAEVFIRYFMDLYNAAQSSMDPTYLDQFSQDCSLCDSLIANIREDKAAGYTYEGGEVIVSRASFGEVRDLRVEGAFSINQAALNVEEPGGSRIDDLSAPAESLTSGAILTWSSTDSTWILAQWDVN